MLHRLLWEANSDLAQGCLYDTFVQSLADGSLDATAFRRYVAQDVFFLRAFLQAYALAAAKSANLEQARCLHRLMGGVLDELELHGRYATSLGIELERATPLPAARAYTDFLLRTAWSASLAETIAAMTPCMRLYAWLGRILAPRRHEDHPYGDWIDTYGSPAFEALAVELETWLDVVAADTPAIRDAYRYALLCERAFFAAPLQLTG